MNPILNFNSETHNFWPIYHSLSKYYPIGLARTEHSAYFSYPGLKELYKIVVDVIHKENDFYQSWLRFQSKLSNTLNKDYQGTTMGQQPALSTDLILERTENENFTTSKKLSINLSLAGKFYTIYGIDDSAYLERQDDRIIRHYYAINAITTSPYKEFEHPFKKTRQLIEQCFPDYKFIPFAVHSMVVKGLQVRYSDKEICTVYDALFNNKLDYKNEMIFQRGDTSYGYDEYWRIPDTEDRDITVSVSAPPATDN